MSTAGPAAGPDATVDRAAPGTGPGTAAVPPPDGPVTDAPAPPSAVRTWLRSRPLRTRLVAILVLVLLAALVASGWAAQSLLRGYLLDRVDTGLEDASRPATAYALQAVSAATDPFSQFDTPRGIPGGYVVTYSVDGAPTRSFPPNPKAGGPRLPSSIDADDLATPRFFTTASVDGRQSYRVYARAFGVSEGASVVYSYVAVPLTQVDETVNQLRALLVGLGLAVVGLGALLGGLAIRRAFRPLVEVEETAAAIAAGDLSRRIPERPATTEVGRLTASLNAMLAHIESAFRAREASEARTRRFAADASHELRTPLASIRGFAELYRQGAVPADEVPRTMRRIEDEATRMGGLVEDLLLLARLDEQRPARSEPVDLAVLAGDAVHDVRGLDPDRPVRLVGLDAGGGPAPAVVRGDEDRLRQVVANLVANAVRHTPAGTPVEVAVGVDPGRDGTPRTAVLEVRDHGAGLTPEQAQRVFERFFRVDSSRQRGRGGGSGLGLSIVSAVVAAHGGHVSVRTTPGGGATFRVGLPEAAADTSRR